MIFKWLVAVVSVLRVTCVSMGKAICTGVRCGVIGVAISCNVRYMGNKSRQYPDESAERDYEVDEMITQIIPSYTFGGFDAYEAVPQIVAPYGTKVCFVGGETALSIVEPMLRPIMEKAGFTITGSVMYGKECTVANGRALAMRPEVQTADMIFAIGGGKAIDTVKVICEEPTRKPFFTFPTVASTCAALSKVSIVYTDDHVFEEVRENTYPAVHAFINSDILVAAPTRFVWAGMGDTVAKHFESHFSARGRETDYETQMGLALSSMCVDPIIRGGAAAMKAAEAQVRNAAFDAVAMAIIVSTGLVSGMLAEEYNSSVAHALCYGLTTQPAVEEHHLHGEIVAYGVLVLLTMDGQRSERNELMKLYRAIGLPTRLQDLDMTRDMLPPVIARALEVPDAKIAPFTVTAEGLYEAIEALEEAN